MFGKKQEPLKDRIITLPPPPLEERIVACHDCKHLLYRKDAQEVSVVYIGLRTDRADFLYYCPACRKSYDHIERNCFLGRSCRYFRTVPATPARLEEVFPNEAN